MGGALDRGKDTFQKGCHLDNDKGLTYIREVGSLERI